MKEKVDINAIVDEEEENLMGNYFEEDVIETVDEIYEENDIEIV